MCSVAWKHDVGLGRLACTLWRIPGGSRKSSERVGCGPVCATVVGWRQVLSLLCGWGKPRHALTRIERLIGGNSCVGLGLSNVPHLGRNVVVMWVSLTMLVINHCQ